MCVHGGNANTNAMLEIGPPTPDEIEAARLQLNVVFGSV
jgi:hypothetical protein